jgi:glycosyltransferase involved in cell wall biosynthesis
MVIGIDASRANKKIKTGVEWYSYYLIQELKKIFKNNNSNLPIKIILYSSKKLIPDLEKDLPNDWQIKILFWPLKYLWTQIRLAWEIIFNPPDILFIPSHALPIFSSIFHRQLLTVITIHDLGFERFPEVYSFWQRFYTRFVYKWAVHYATKIIAISEFTKKELIDLYRANPQKIEVVYLGYNESIFHPISDKKQIDQILEKYNIKRPYILFVGRLEKKKNVINLIKAFQLLPKGIQLVLVGQPSYGYSNIKFEIRNPSFGFRSGRPELVERAKSETNILEIGYINHQDLPYLYAGAECFVYPSLYEGFGLPILEAMACGCPVVGSSAASIPEIGGQAVLYFRPENPEEIAKAILKIIKDQSFRETMIQKGFEQVKNFSWEKCARETLEIIKKLT